MAEMGSEPSVVQSISNMDRTLYKDKVKILIAMPTGGSIHHWTVDSVIELVSYSTTSELNTNYKFFHGSMGRLTIGYAREVIAEYALDAGMDYILWIDDDMMFHTNVFERLIRHNVDIVAALAFMRVAPFTPVMWKANETKDNKITFETITEYKKGELKKVDAVGFGVCLTRVGILKKIPKPWFMSHIPLGEDIYFTYKCKANGFQPYMDCSTVVKHIGPNLVIGEEQYDEYKETGQITVSYGKKIQPNEKMIGEFCND